jgi:predicted RNase H-like HicB family nuclease
MQREFTAVIQKRGRWYVAYVEEIPGVNTQGRTLTETRRNLKEALRLILDTNRQRRLTTARETCGLRPRRSHGWRMRCA